MKKLRGLVMLLAVFPVLAFADPATRIRTVAESVPSGSWPTDHLQIAERLLDRSKDDCAQEGLVVAWESDIIDHKFLFWESESLQYRCGPNPDAPCDANKGASDGTLNFDGSCSYDDPQVYVDGQMIPVEGTAEAGAGFCALQRMSLRAVDLKGCDGSASCQAPVALLGSDGHLVGLDQGDHIPKILSHVICKN